MFQAISTTALATGFVLNLLLLYLIRRFSQKELGTYKYLLKSFAAYDTFLIVVDHISNPKAVPSHTAFAMISDSKYGTFEMICFGSSCYAVPFVLLLVHLLYRFWIIRSPHKIAMFSDSKFVGLLISTTRDDKLCIRPVIMLVIADTVVILSFSVAATLATVTYRAIKRAQNISEKARKFHLSILVAAIAQTLTPVIFVYTPYFFSLTNPFFGIYSPTFSQLAMVLLSLFPSIDAVMIILLMKPYRQGLILIMGRRKKQVITPVASSFTTNSVPLSNSSNE